MRTKYVPWIIHTILQDISRKDNRSSKVRRSQKGPNLRMLTDWRAKLRQRECDKRRDGNVSSAVRHKSRDKTDKNMTKKQELDKQIWGPQAANPQRPSFESFEWEIGCAHKFAARVYKSKGRRSSRRPTLGHKISRRMSTTLMSCTLIAKTEPIRAAVGQERIGHSVAMKAGGKEVQRRCQSCCEAVCDAASTTFPHKSYITHKEISRFSCLNTTDSKDY